jgi:hypothetical protein
MSIAEPVGAHGAWTRFRTPIALAFISAFTAHLLYVPIDSPLRDQHAAHLIQQWYRWNLFLGTGPVVAGAIFYS